MHCEIIDSLSSVSAADWDSLNGDGNPFVTHAFLHGLEQTGCVCERTGWIPQHVLAYDDGTRDKPIGAVPLYLKFHSYGEYVFDWAWANAYARAGLEYYPKLLAAVPFTPVTGPRLLVSDSAADRRRIDETLVNFIHQYARRFKVSSIHCLFTDSATTRALQQSRFMIRHGNQFHWHNRNYTDFEDFISALTSKHRKNIRRERRLVRDAGLTMEVLSGEMLTEEHWDLMYQFYRSTVDHHGAHAYLNRSFFHWLAQHMFDRTVMVLARAGSRYVAGALNMRGGDTLFGRYWGSSQRYDGLHFETCYYSAIDYCIGRGLNRFEAGAQGEHKLSRGLLPTTTVSAHWLHDHRFANAIADFIDQESTQLRHYAAALDSHSPFRREV